MRHALIVMIAAAAPLAVASAGGPAAPDSVVGTIRATPSALDVTTFFNGASLRIDGTAPAGQSLAVVLRGASRTLDLKRKGKVWGLLWMNVGEISFQDVPSVYMVASSGPICDLAPYDVRARLGLGLDVLGVGSAARPGEEEATRLFAELVKLKKQEGLYATAEGTLKTEGAAQGVAHYSTTLSLPARIPEGTYDVALWGFHDGNGGVLAETKVAVAEVGVTHDIAELARTHGVLYGVLAVIIALATGLITGIIFGMGGKRGH